MIRKAFGVWAGVGRLELPTLGLEKRIRPVLPVWNALLSITSVGIRGSDSGEIVPFGHEYAPQYAPRSGPGSPTFASLQAVVPFVVNTREVRSSTWQTSRVERV